MLHQGFPDPAPAAGYEDDAVLQARITGGILDVSSHGLDISLHRPIPFIALALMRMPRHRGPTLADEEIEIAAAIGLKHPLDIEPLIAALHRHSRRLPVAPALGEI